MGPARSRILVSMLAGGLLGAILGGLTSVLGEALGAGLGHVLGVKNDLWGATQLRGSLLEGLGFGLGLGLGLLLGLSVGRGGREPKRVRNWRAISLRPVLTAALAYGVFSRSWPCSSR